MPKYFEMPLKYVIKGILTEKSAFRHQHPHLSCMENLSNFFMKYCLTRVGNPCCCFPMLWLLQALSQWHYVWSNHCIILTYGNVSEQRGGWGTPPPPTTPLPPYGGHFWINLLGFLYIVWYLSLKLLVLKTSTLLIITYRWNTVLQTSKFNPSVIQTKFTMYREILPHGDKYVRKHLASYIFETHNCVSKILLLI